MQNLLLTVAQYVETLYCVVLKLYSVLLEFDVVSCDFS